MLLFKDAVVSTFRSDQEGPGSNTKRMETIWNRLRARNCYLVTRQAEHKEPVPRVPRWPCEFMIFLTLKICFTSNLARGHCPANTMTRKFELWHVNMGAIVFVPLYMLRHVVYGWGYVTWSLDICTIVVWMCQWIHVYNDDLLIRTVVSYFK